MSLRLGTFNVWGLPETFGFGNDVTSRTREIARRLSRSDLDVLLIQEAWTDEVRRTLVAGALLADFEVADTQGAHGGLMTLSRRSILDSRFERFRFRGDPERVAQGEFLGGKGFQTTTIESEDGPLVFMNTHLHARYRRERPRLNSAVRVAQLLQVLRRLVATEGTVVIGGDFNCSDGDIEYEVFRGLSGAFELGGGSDHPTLSTMNYYKRHRSEEDKRIDFLFVRPGADTSWKAEGARLLFAETARIREIDRSLSDHFGFRAELALDRVVRPVARTSAPPADPRAVALARDLLAVGDEEVLRREREHREQAFAWGAASLSAFAVRTTPIASRRGFLRGVLSTVACASAIPVTGYGALAYFDSRGKQGAFADARAVLSEIESIRPGLAA